MKKTITLFLFFLFAYANSQKITVGDAGGSMHQFTDITSPLICQIPAQTTIAAIEMYSYDANSTIERYFKCTYQDKTGWIYSSYFAHDDNYYNTIKALEKTNTASTHIQVATPEPVASVQTPSSANQQVTATKSEPVTETKPIPKTAQTKASSVTQTQVLPATTQTQTIASAQAVYTPTDQDAQKVTYRRSSLYTLMVDNSGLPKADVIKAVFLKSPIPDKFNDHNLPDRVIVVNNSEDEISNYLYYHHVARDLVAKWFNRSPQGGFNMSMVADRGSYNATEMDAGIAKSSKIGLAKLADAGEELIGNTFVLVSVYKYTNEEKITKGVNNGLSIFSKIMGEAGVNTSGITNSIAKLDTALIQGYIVKTNAYLFQLNWNDSIASIFYNNYWTTDANLDMAKKQAFDKSDIFSLKYVGKDESSTSAQKTTYSNITEEQIIEKAETNALHRVIFKLQKKHEAFRTKTPLYSTDPLSAKIGLKEGLEKGDKYEVLEQTVNKDGRTVYKGVGTIKVDGDQIWDNEFYATGETPSTGNYIDRTLFIGANKKFYSGMLIRQK